MPHDSPKFGDHLSATVTREAKLVGFSESQGRGRAAYGILESGTASFGVSGSSSQGEEGTLEASKIFVRALNKAGGAWSEPILLEDGELDAISCCTSDASVELQMQVVRAVANREFWKELGSTGEVRRPSSSLAQIATLAKKAVELKAAKIPPLQRSRITLLLNALDTPAMCFDDVVFAFQAEYGPWAEGLGFRGIWVVGASPAMVRRLTPR